MPSLSFGEPFMIPREILSEPEQKLFDEIKEKNPEEFNQRYKWWSMYDIMKFYGSGLIPKVNAANFFPFKIDLTSPELSQNKFRDADLVHGFDTAMMNLNDVTAAITDYYNNAKAEWTRESAESTLRAAIHGGKQSTRQKAKSNYKNKTKKGGQTFKVDPKLKINEAFSANILKDQCTLALFGDVFHSRNRIFLVDNQLPTYNQPTYEELRASADKLIAEHAAAKMIPAAIAAAAAVPGAAPVVAAVPAAAAAAGGGRKYKTRKLKQRKSKKGKGIKSRRVSKY
jgi:hypothetical protein